MKSKKGYKAQKEQKAKEEKMASIISHFTPDYIISNKDNLDFRELCKIYPFDEKLAYILRYKVDWTSLYIYNAQIDRMFYYNNEGFIDWEKISAHEDLPVSALRKCPDRLNWSLVCKNTQMTENTLETFYKYLDLDKVSEYQNLTVRFIENHLSDFKPCITSICDHQTLSMSFMREYADILDWSAISRSQLLSEAFMTEMSDYIDWTWACAKQKMSAKFIETNIDKINLYCLIKRDAYIPKSIQRTPFYEVCKLYMKKGYDLFNVENIIAEAGT